MGRQMPKVSPIPTPEEHKALLEWIREWEQMQRESAKRIEQKNTPAPPPKQQNIAPYMLDTWGKSLQSLFANKGVGDILPRFTVDHLANLNSPFYQALQQRRGQGQPMASIQPYPNSGEPTASIQPYPNITQPPQGMLAEDMISLYALGFRDSLMRVSPHLGSRGIPVFENTMNAPVIEPPKPTPTPTPTPTPAPAPPPPPKPAPAPEPPKFEGKGLTFAQAQAIYDKYGIPRPMRTSITRGLGWTPYIDIEEFDWAMRTGNVKRARELFNEIWAKDPVYMTPTDRSGVADFRSRMRERFVQMEMEQLRNQMAGR